MRGYLAGVVFGLGLLSMEPSCDAAAQDPPPAPVPVDPELARTVELMRQLRAIDAASSGSTASAAGTGVATGLGTLALGMLALARWGEPLIGLIRPAPPPPQPTAGPDLAAQLARIEAGQTALVAGQARVEANQQRDHEELIRVRDNVHDLRDTLHPRVGLLEADVRQATGRLDEVDTLADRVQSLEREIPPRRVR